ncbi:MAG: oxidoreductase [Gemmatales bacterium]|nr:MAG: oxidoreductase [Gemmatales bacterium]
MFIALTGATGFLGRYLVDATVRHGHRLRCWYRPQSDRSGFDSVSDAIEWRQGQLGDADATRELVRGVEAVVHCAVDWEGSGNRRVAGREDVVGFAEKNIVGSIRLFEEAYRADVPRFVFISTCAVHEVILDDRPLDEAHPLWPTSHYGAHKAALEKFVHSYGLGKGWPICALRPTGIYGLDHPPQASKWFELVGKVVRGEPVSSSAGGKEVHAADVARAVLLLLKVDAERVAGQAFNCYDRYIADQDVARIAKEITGSNTVIADLNKGPKHQIETKKLRALGMTFGGEELLRKTIEELVAAYQRIATQ